MGPGTPDSVRPNVSLASLMRVVYVSASDVLSARGPAGNRSLFISSFLELIISLPGWNSDILISLRLKLDMRGILLKVLYAQQRFLNVLSSSSTWANLYRGC